MHYSVKFGLNTILPMDTSITFSQEELTRYARHSILPGFGMEAQSRLKSAGVLVIGAGGLGAPLLQYLTAAGVGRIGIIDPDRVALSNLQRQILFGSGDIGKLKVEVAAERLRSLNPNVHFDLYPFALQRENALDIIAKYDLVADGSDNFPTRYLVNDACVLIEKPLVYGAVFRSEGQVSVFNHLQHEGVRGPNYRNLYPTPPEPGSVPSCAEGGVLGILPGIIGSLQANEVIKILSGTGEPLSGKLLLFDAHSGQSRLLRIPQQPPYPVTELEDYEQSCGLPSYAVAEITPLELQQWNRAGIAFFLLDVRETWEFQEYNLGGHLLPLGQIADKGNQLPHDLPIVVTCQSGARSLKAAEMLQKQFGHKEVFNLKGGIQACMQQNIAI